MTNNIIGQISPVLFVQCIFPNGENPGANANTMFILPKMTPVFAIPPSFLLRRVFRIVRRPLVLKTAPS
eukprot:5803120-Heterocapsa_arctica.AAC.1